MSERDRENYRKIKADPAKYAAYLERKRKERKPRKEYERDRKRKWRAANPDDVRRLRDAHHAVEVAIIDGLLVRPKHCTFCGAGGEIEAHHRSYAPEHWLAVIWLCKFCHNKEHYPSGLARRNKGGRRSHEPTQVR